MALRMRQKLQDMSAGKIYYEVLVPNEDTGYCEMKRVDQCAVLPSPGMTDLDKMLKAGVPLDQVDCKLLDPKGTVKLPNLEENTVSNNEEK